MALTSGWSGVAPAGRRAGPRPGVEPGAGARYCTAKKARNGAQTKNPGLGSCCDPVEYFLRNMIIVSMPERRMAIRNLGGCWSVIKLGAVSLSVWRGTRGGGG